MNPHPSLLHRLSIGRLRLAFGMTVAFGSAITIAITLANFLAAPAHAQPAPTKSTKPAKPSSNASKKPAVAAPAAPAKLPKADGEQMSAAAMTHLGTYHCEFSQSVDVALDSKDEGYVAVRLGPQRWVMKPVLSSTGALRLEDVRGHMLMLQIANKSMLMDVRAGRRVVDECVHDKQREASQSAQAGSALLAPADAASAPR